LVPVAAIVAKNSGWSAVFTIGVTFNIIAALLALFVLKPMRVKHFAKSRIDFPQAAAPSVGGTRTT
jgi:MFS transporter, OFA family, oxalate/formate antiporter